MKGAHRALIFPILLVLCLVTGALTEQTLSFGLSSKMLQDFIEMPYDEVSKQLSKVPPVEATEYAVLLGKIHLFQFKNASTAERYFSLALVYAKQHNFDKARILLSLAQVNDIKQQLQRAMEYLDEAAAAAKGENNPNILRASLGFLGKAACRSGKFDKSLAAYDELLKLAADHNDVLLQAQTLFDISEVHYMAEDYKKAKQSVTSAINIFIKCENEKGLADCYNMLGNLSLRKKDKDKAMDYYLKAISHYKSTNDWRGKGDSNYNLGLVYKESKDYDSAIEALRRAVFCFTKSASTEGVGITQMELGRIYYLRGEYDKADSSLKQAEFLLNETSALFRVAQIQDYLGDLSAVRKNSNQAASYYRISALNYQRLNLPAEAERVSKKLKKLKNK